MPHTLTKTVYRFEELSDRAKEKARDWWRELEASDFDSELLYDDFAQVAKILGIEFDQKPVPLMNGKTRYEPAIYWTGFSSQGDGACFEGRYSYAKSAPKAIRTYAGVDTTLHGIADDLATLQARHFYKLAARCTHSGHYCHSGCMAVETYDTRDEYRDIGDAGDELRDILCRFADWIYRQLEAEYEYRMSDENVDESIIANEYDFDEEGRRAI